MPTKLLQAQAAYEAIKAKSWPSTKPVDTANTLVAGQKVAAAASDLAFATAELNKLKINKQSASALR